MINDNTVLVLGAGSSQHYQYILGQNLYYRIIDNLNLIDNDEILNADYKDMNFYKLPIVIQLIRAGFDREKIKSFQNALKLADRTSIDKFLEKNEEYINIGKICISQALIPFEYDAPVRTGNNWYQLLFNELDSDIKDFHNNKLSIITFNYDRSLENYLFNTVKYSYAIKDDEKAAALMKHIPIIHVHGQLDYLSWQNKQKGYRNYGEHLTQARLIKASESIKIIHESSIDNDPDLNQAREIIKHAKYIYFLGFGYDLTNIKRLRLEGNLKGTYRGTGYNLSNNKRQQVIEYFKEIDTSLIIDNRNIMQFFEDTRFF